MGEFRVREWKLEELKGRKIWIPHMCDSAFVLAAVMRSIGYDSSVLPRSSDAGFGLGRKHTDGDQCIPSIITTEDILQRVNSLDFNPDREAFFQGKSEGPCRFGRYYMNQQAILHDLGLGNVPIFTLDNRNAYGGLGSAAKIFAWDGMIAQAMLERSLHFTRPSETREGASQEVYKNYLSQLCNLVEKGIPGKKSARKAKILANSHKRELEEMLSGAAAEFLQVSRQDEKPVIFITGEIYVRTSDVANQTLVKKIENLGGIALLEPVTSFFDYVNEFKFREACWNGAGGLGMRAKTWVEIGIMRRDEHDISEIFSQVLGEFAHDPPADLVIELGKRYVHERYKGEAIVTLGACEYYANRVHGIVNTLPFNCMPGMIVTSKTDEFRANNKNIPFLNLAYDGNSDSSRDEQLGVFMYQVKERMKNG